LQRYIKYIKKTNIYIIFFNKKEELRITIPHDLHFIPKL